MWISALVTLLNLALAAAIGARLLSRAREREAGPEGWLAGYFLCGALFGAAIHVAVYGSLGADGPGPDPALTGRLLMLSSLANGFAGTCIYVFTWRTFRADEEWARALVWIGACLFATSWVFQAATGGFGIRVFPDPAYWLERASFTAAFVWAALESSRHRRQLIRRRHIGLGEPVLETRFGLWTLWAGATATLALSDLAARIAYYCRTGETARLLVDEAVPIIFATLAITSLIGAAATLSLWLAFFPSPRYLRWIRTRLTTGTP